MIALAVRTLTLSALCLVYHLSISVMSSVTTQHIQLAISNTIDTYTVFYAKFSRGHANIIDKVLLDKEHTQTARHIIVNTPSMHPDIIDNAWLQDFIAHKNKQ